MSLEHAILGFLNYKPFTGYDLKKVFDISVRHFWPADQAQIYRTLGRLVEQNYATVEIIEQTDRPSRKVYHITEAGREELRRFLTTPIIPEENRSAPLIQVFFSGMLSDEEALAIFERGAAMMRDMLGAYNQVRPQAQEFEQMVNSRREVFFWYLTLESGFVLAKAQLEWMESVIQRFRNGEVPQK